MIRKFYFKVFGVLIFFSVSLTLLGLYSYFSHNDSYLLEFADKRERLESLDGQRLVFLGGSNVAFGLDSRMIEQKTGMRVVNYGMHAGLGLKYLLDTAKPLLCQGDVVVVMPEYNHFYESSCNGETGTMGMIPWYGKPKDFLDLNTQQWHRMTVGFIKNLVQAPINDFKMRRGKEDKKVFSYSRSGFNEYGDEISHWNLPSDAVMTKEGIGTATFQSLNEKFIRYFIQWAEDLQARGCRVILMPPAVSADFMRISVTHVEKLASILKSQGHPFAAAPEEFMYPIDYMYNTYYHLNRKGVIANSNQICEALKTELN